MKVAKLVAISLLTRVIVESTATEEEVIEEARENFIEKIRTDLYETVEYVQDDEECPYDPHADGKEKIPLTKGQTVQIFENWRSQENSEGKAKLVKFISSDDDYEYWRVKFESDGAIVSRFILKP